MGEVHPPLGATKIKKGWRSLGAAITTLPNSQMEFAQVETQWSLDGGHECDQTTGSEEGLTWSPIE